MNSSAPTAASTTGRSTRSPSRPAARRRDPRARRVGCRVPARAQRGGGERDGREARGVDQQRELRAAERDEPGREQRAGREARVARRLHPPARRGQPVRAGRGGHERELGWLRDRGARGQQRGQRQDRGQRVGERQPGRDERLGDRGGEQHARALHPVREPAAERRERDDRQHRRAEQRRHRVRAPGQVVDAQRERDQRDNVARGREADREREQPQVARPGCAPHASRQRARPLLRRAAHAGATLWLPRNTLRGSKRAFTRGQPRVALLAERRAHPLAALVAEEVQVRAARAVRGHQLPEPARPGDRGRVVGRVLPQRQRVHDEARAALGERGVLAPDPRHRAAPADEEQLRRPFGLGRGTARRSRRSARRGGRRPARRSSSSGSRADRRACTGSPRRA